MINNLFPTKMLREAAKKSFFSDPATKRGVISAWPLRFFFKFPKRMWPLSSRVGGGKGVRVSKFWIFSLQINKTLYKIQNFVKTRKK